MGHFGNGEWNDPSGPVFRKTITSFGPTSGNASTTQITDPDTAAETANPTQYNVLRQGLYVAYIYIVPSSNGTTNATVKGGVTYTDDVQTVNKDLTNAAAWTTAAGGTSLLTPTPFEAVAGSTIKFYYTTTGNSGSHQNLTAYLLVRAL